MKKDKKDVFGNSDKKQFVIEQFAFMKNHLNSIDILLNEKAPKELIQEQYKILKEWSKSQYNEFDKYVELFGYIPSFYFPMIQDIYVNSFGMAKTNSSVGNIKDAIVDALDYFTHWDLQLKSFMTSHSNID
jgi:hypothetical protein